MNKNKIIIKGQPYKVTFFNKAERYEGRTSFENKVIELYKEEDEKEMQKTIIHELFHAYFYECGLIEYAYNETIMYFVENVFHDLIKNANKICEMSKAVENGR